MYGDLSISICDLISPINDALSRSMLNLTNEGVEDHPW